MTLVRTVSMMVLLLLHAAQAFTVGQSASNLAQEYDPGDKELKGWANMWQTIIWNRLLEMQQQRNLSSALHFVYSGDSTLRMQRTFLCSLLDDSFLPPKSSLLDVIKAGRRVSLPDTCWSAKLQVRVTYVESFCCERPAMPQMTFSDPGWDASTASTILLFNCGLHLLQLGAARPFSCLPQLLNYETLLRDIVTSAREGQTQLQIFMTSHWICSDAYTSDYAAAVQTWRSNPSKTVQECVAASDATLGSPEAILDACQSASFTAEGTNYVNQKALLTLRLLSEEKPLARIPVLDAYSITQHQCWATEKSDGRHYIPLIPVEIQELLRITQEHLAVLSGGGYSAARHMAYKV